MVDELTVDFVSAEEGGIAYDEELLAGTGDGYIQFPVNGDSARMRGYREDIQLVGLADGGAVQDDVALAALIPFDGVDGDLFGTGEVEGCQFVGNHGNLVAEGYDDADAAGSIEREVIGLTEFVYGSCQAGYGVRLGAVDLVGLFGRRIGGVHEAEPILGKQLLDGVCSIKTYPLQRGLLMGGGDDVEYAFVEAVAGKMADGRMHASLTVKGGTDRSGGW